MDIQASLGFLKASVEEKADKGEMSDDVPWTYMPQLDPLEDLVSAVIELTSSTPLSFMSQFAPEYHWIRS